jgi:hypothetical protein
MAKKLGPPIKHLNGTVRENLHISPAMQILIIDEAQRLKLKKSEVIRAALNMYFRIELPG